MSTNTTPVALVTGAARGIGLEIARQFIARGHRVAMVDIEAQQQQAAYTQSGWTAAQAIAIACDVSDDAQVASAIAQTVRAFGRIDAVVNNAGIADFGPILDCSAAVWRRMMEVNLTGPFLVTQAAAPVMLRNAGASKGAIVNIASISGLRASSLRVAYGTSKAALIHLTKQQALELGNAGIRVNAVSPGPVETAMAKKVHTPAIRRDYHDAIPLGRYGSEAEIAQAVVWLCGPEASFVNGQCLAVDGGFDAIGIGLPTLRQTS